MNKKGKLLFSCLLALTLVATAACNTGGSKKKKSSSGGGGGGNISETVWQGGFSGAVTIGAGTSVVEGREAQVMPSSSASSYATLANKRSFADPDSGDTYNFTFEFSFTAKVGSEDKQASDYIESQNPSGDKTLLQFKGWPSQLAKLEEYPRFTVKAKGTCNGESKEKSYTLVLNPLDKVFKKMTLAEMYTMAEDNKKLQWMTNALDQSKEPIQDAYKVDLSQTAGQNAYWVEVPGVITYCTNDNNWGIFRDGEHSIQVYRLDAYSSWTAQKSDLMNVPVMIQSEISYGYGNIQLSYVYKITKLEGEEAAKVTTPSEPIALTENDVKTGWVGNPIFNRPFAKTTVTYKGGLVKANNDAATTPVEASSINLTSDRYEFKVQIGDTEFYCASDYHAVKDGNDFNNAFKALIQGASVGSTISIGGTLRWCNDRAVVSPSEPTKVKNDYTVRVAGNWVLVPYSVSLVG